MARSQLCFYNPHPLEAELGPTRAVGSDLDLPNAVEGHMGNRRLRGALLAVVTGVIALVGNPRAQVAGTIIIGANGTAFYGIGDLAGGGVNSIVQDATQVGATVFAVGAST